PDAFALERAKQAGVKTCFIDHRAQQSRADFDKLLAAQLIEAGVEWIALAGFMRVLSKSFLNTFPGRIVNIHPALLPAFPGVNAQQQAFDYGVKVTGCTVHFVDDGVDSGPIILQKAVPVLPDDTPEALKARILEQAHVALVEGLQLIAEGRITASEGGRLVNRMEPSPHERTPSSMGKPARHYDVIVLGRSLGSLLVAALLARRELGVLVLGQGKPAPTYRVEGHILARRTFTLLSSTSPDFRRIRVELAQTQNFRRLVTPLDATFAFFDGEVRFEILLDMALFGR